MNRVIITGTIGASIASGRPERQYTARDMQYRWVVSQHTSLDGVFTGLLNLGTYPQEGWIIDPSVDQTLNSLL